MIFTRFFVINKKSKVVIMVIFKRLISYLFIEIIFSLPLFELRILLSEMKHTCTI